MEVRNAAIQFLLWAIGVYGEVCGEGRRHEVVRPDLVLSTRGAAQGRIDRYL